MKITFFSHGNKTLFHKKGFELGLILKMRVFGTWKWSILRSYFLLTGDLRSDRLTH